MYNIDTKGAETDERTCKRMRGGDGDGGDVATILCTISRSGEKRKIRKYLAMLAMWM